MQAFTPVCLPMPVYRGFDTTQVSVDSSRRNLNSKYKKHGNMVNNCICMIV